MSWLLGRFGAQQPEQPQLSDAGTGKGPPPRVGGNSPPKEGNKWAGFDPTSLERAAKIARELDASSKCLYFKL